MKIYAARDNDGNLFLFNEKPTKAIQKWIPRDCSELMIIDRNDLPQVKWEDEEPTEVKVEIANNQLEAPDQFDTSTLSPFTKILARDTKDDRWMPTHFGFFNYTAEGKRAGFNCTNGAVFRYCIPYNEETKHLLGTKQEEPSKYKWWK